jgi:hypothetical protein
MLQCYVIVYVDGFKIAGPKDKVEKVWGLIRGPNPRVGERGIVLDDPKPAGKFSGCNHEVSHVWAPSMHADRESVQPLEGVAIKTLQEESRTQKRRKMIYAKTKTTIKTTLARFSSRWAVTQRKTLRSMTQTTQRQR